MGESTRIEWTGSTWNPFIGCRRVSSGCANCYAERIVNGRMGGDFRVVRRAADATFNAPLRWHKPRRIFACSISDFFIEEADPWRDDAWDVIRRTPQHTYQILTKRPERIDGHLPADWGRGWPNVWLGTSGETHQFAFERGALISQVPARVHFLSAEPWLETDVTNVSQYYWTVLNFYEWVIVGGESGPHCRPMDERTARALVEGAQRAKVPVFLKQLGGHPDKRSHEKAVLDGRRWTEFPL